MIDISCQNGLLVRVADDVPGCSGDEMLQLGQRGLRLDKAIQGHGLGLAIARDITEFYGGNLLIARSGQLGGLSVSAQLLSP